MKKGIALVLTVILVLFAAVAAAEGSGAYTCRVLADGTAEIRSFGGGTTAPVIPQEIDGHRVTAIGSEAFSRWDLTSVSIPEGVSAIGDRAFSACTGLTFVSLPDSVASMGVNPFDGCSALAAIHVSPDHPYFACSDGVLSEKRTGRLVCYPRGKADPTYSIPGGIAVIGDYAFSGCSGLTSVTFPDSVTSIGACAFSFCGGLTSVTLPDSVTSVGDRAFFWCTGLTSVALPDSVTSIGEEAFAQCPHLTLTVPRGSWAAEYCRANGLTCTYAEAIDGMNN